MHDIFLDFVGPFSFIGDNSLFHCTSATSPSIYLWTIKQRRDDTHLIHYVGETTQLVKRHREHLIYILGFNYGIFDPGKAQEGICELIWLGLWRDKTPDGPSRQLAAYDAIHNEVARYLAILNIFFAPLTVDRQLRKHIEGCIGFHLRNKHPEFKALYPDDNHVGKQGIKNQGNLLITSPEPIRGLDPIIPY